MLDIYLVGQHDIERKCVNLLNNAILDKRYDNDFSV